MIKHYMVTIDFDFDPESIHWRLFGDVPGIDITDLQEIDDPFGPTYSEPLTERSESNNPEESEDA